MREILFRGKRVDNGEWVYGTPIPYQNGIVVICKEYQRNENVCPATVGQYTGLKDKNGVKIFEGDIVQTTKYGVDNGRGQNYSGKDKFAVWYANGTFTLKNKLRLFCLRPDIDVEVIGNRWDGGCEIDSSRTKRD